MRPRARRFPFTASVELTDVQSEKMIQARTVDLSVYGCRVETYVPFLAGTRVRVRIAHASDHFVAIGRTYARADGEMGIIFTRIEANDQQILEKWIEDRRRREAKSA